MPVNIFPLVVFDFGTSRISITDMNVVLRNVICELSLSTKLSQLQEREMIQPAVCSGSLINTQYVLT